MLDDAVYALLMMGQSGLDYGSSALTASGVTTVVKPSGVQIGDVIFAWALNIASGENMSTTGGATWTRQTVALANGGSASLFWKILNATDVANTWTVSGSPPASPIQTFQYRGNGATAVTTIGTQSNGFGGTTLSLAGFSKAAGHYAAIAFYTAPTNSGAGGIVVPSGFTERRRDSGSGYVGIMADTLGSYVDGTAVQFTNCDAAAVESGILVEVTGP